MSVASHLGIRVRDYDARIRTFIPWYEEILGAAAQALDALEARNPDVVDLGTGSGALAARCLAAVPRAQITGIDEDAGMLALAERRSRGTLATVCGDFLSAPLPRCDAITASFALHHIRTRRAKGSMYARCFAALRRGGLFVNADCCLASNPRIAARDRGTWRAHLQRTYTKSRAETFLRAWAKEDVYFRLADEIDLLKSAGFAVDVPWRRGSFAVIVGTKARRRASGVRRQEGFRFQASGRHVLLTPSV